MHLPHLPHLLLLFFLASLTLADIEIITPNANTIWAGGSTVEMSWRDNGGTPSLDKFISFTLYLCWGSNAVPMCNQVLGPAGAKFSSASMSTKFLVPAAAGKNGRVYFLKMETVATLGGFTWNYSPRFTLTDMIGVFSSASLIEQGRGDVLPPDRKDTTVADAAPQDGGAELAKVPYGMQIGPTRYAPMQRQPGNRITARTASRLFPTSEYVLFTTKGPKPDAQTTITQRWDYSVTSRENTASPAPHPGDDEAMQRYLNRWKD